MPSILEQYNSTGIVLLRVVILGTLAILIFYVLANDDYLLSSFHYILPSLQ